MKIFDPHIHMTSRTTGDYSAMAEAGILAIIEPAFWLGQPRTSAGSFVDYFNSLLGWERFRASQFGIRHFCTIGLNPKEANNPRLSDEVIDLLPRFLAKEGVVAVGEIGYDDQSATEEKYFARQVEIAMEFDLPVLVHTPHRDKKRGTIRSIDLLREVGFPEERALIDHNNEETLPLVLDTGCWAGHSIYPFTKMNEDRMATLVKEYGGERILINSAADWGISDPLKVPKTTAIMRKRGICEEEIEKIVWQNPATFSLKAAMTLPPKTGPSWNVRIFGFRKEARMARKRFTAEQIIMKLREAEVGLAQGQTVGQVCKQIGVTEQTYYRWRKEYGGLRLNQAKRLKVLEKENARLKKLVADLSLDKQILKEVSSGNF